jgi:hypothetical protein
MPLHDSVHTYRSNRRRLSTGNWRLPCSVDVLWGTEERMLLQDIHGYARRLAGAYGPRAIAEAAQRARLCEEQGDQEQAETWRAIERILMISRGSSFS